MEAPASSSGRVDEEKRKNELRKQVEKLRCFNEALLAENEMFERFLSRTDNQNQQPGDVPQKSERCQKKNAGIHSNLSGHLHRLSIEDKLHVSQEEIEKARKDLEKLRKANEDACDDSEASLKEAELRLAEIRKAKKDFEHKLRKRMTDKRLEMKEPEKCLQYLEDKAKSTQVEILSMKNNALKVTKNKLKHDIEQKMEKGKISYEEIFQDWSDQKSETSLEELRADSLKAQRVLAAHKEKLQNSTSEHRDLCKEIKKKKRLLRKTERALQRCEEARLKAEKLRRHLRLQMANHQVPDVSRYFEARSRFRKLQQDVQAWERKVRIAQMTSRTSAEAAACGADGGDRPAGCRSPVKLPLLPERRRKGGRPQMFDVVAKDTNSDVLSHF